MKPDFTLSAESKVLASVLKDAAVDDVVTYAQLSKSIGRDVRSECKSALQSARELVRKESRMIFDVVRGIGLKRLSDDNIVDLSDKARDRTRRLARRTVKKLICVDFDKLSNEKKSKHNAAVSMFGAIAELSAEKSMRRLQQCSSESNSEQLPTAKAAIAALGAVI